jgi:23S rRNA (cytidine1920-2'-O)/16S rRNA (cytidine1409-2'-O)-methyltransferase
MVKKRVDSVLVDKGLAESRAKAQALILAGEVSVDGRKNIKPGTMVSEEAAIALDELPPFVGRGGLKLDYALGHFQLEVSSKVTADIGASTGGFTDCLLKQGARKVYAVDVGHGQMDYRLRKDPRVVVMERINARYPITLPEKVDLTTVDVSFISLQKVVPSVSRLLKADGTLVVLVKPQFEARRNEVQKGVIKEPAMHAKVLGRFIAWLTENGFRLKDLVSSPILGASGNREFFVLIELT